MHAPISSQAGHYTETTPSAASTSTSRHKLYVLLIFGLWLALYVPGLFSPSLLDDADSIHAEAAREMVLRHDWSTLYINNGFRYLEKAPLLYWGMATSYKLFGVSDWSARLPLALGVLASLLAVYSLARRAVNETAGLYAAVALGLSFGPYIFTRILIPDLLVGLWLTIGLDFFLRGLEQEQPSLISCWGLAVTTALNILTKGLIGCVFPFFIIFFYLLMTKNLRHFLKMRLVSSFIIFLAVAAPWHIIAGIENPPMGQSKGFFWFYFINEQFLRYLNERFPKDYATVPFYIFWGGLLIWMMPWSAFLFNGLAKIPYKWREWTNLDRRGRALLLCGVWAAFILVFFSFSSRQEYYTIPALPALAILIGIFLADEQHAPADSKVRRSGRRVAATMFGIAVPAFLVAMTLLWYSEAVPIGSHLADVLTQNPGDYSLSFGHIFDLTPKAMGFFRVPLALTGIALLLGTLASWLLRRKGKVVAGNIALALMSLIFLLCAHQGLSIFAPILSSKELSDAVSQAYKPGDAVVINGTYEDGSTLNFYGHFRLHVVDSRDNGNLYYGSLFPDSPKIFENDDSLAKLWTSPRRVFLWTEIDDIPASVKNTGYTILARSGGKYILVNHPEETQTATPGA